MGEPHVCDFAKRPCQHAHTRAIDPRRGGPAAPRLCMCCGATLLLWSPWAVQRQSEDK